MVSEVEYNVNLKTFNTYGIGGKTKYVIRPKNVKELIADLDYLKDNNIDYLVLGAGSNVILPDEDYNGAIIKLDNLNQTYYDGDFIYAEAGVSLNALVKELLDNNYTNIAPLYGIPGTLGGALVGNAGVPKKSIYDDIQSVTLIEEGLVKTKNVEEIKYSYRSTEFKNNKNIIILGATLKLESGDSEKAWEEIKNNLQERSKKQPLEYKNAGSVFKNPPDISAGKLIEECGLKDYQIGGAKVSNKHANFIINLHDATAKDIKDLINVIKEKVKKEKNIDLELEQIIIKW